MITNVTRVSGVGDIQRSVRYTIAPKKNKDHPEYKAGERVLALDTQILALDVKPEHNKTSHNIANQIKQWNIEKRGGRKQPTKQGVMLTISFDESDTEQFYRTYEAEDKDGKTHTVRALDEQKVIDIGKEALQKTMPGERPSFISLHGDTKCLHLHIVTTLVNSEGEIYASQERDFRAWERTNEELEKKYNLKQVEHRKAFEHEGPHRVKELARPRKNSIAQLAKKNEIAPVMDLQGKVNDAYETADKDFNKFLDNIKEQGVHVHPNMNSTVVNGFAFSLDGEKKTKASDLGAKFKWNNLSKELNYVSTRDYQRVADLKLDPGQANTPNRRPPLAARPVAADDSRPSPGITAPTPIQSPGASPTVKTGKLSSRRIAASLGDSIGQPNGVNGLPIATKQTDRRAEQGSAVLAEKASSLSTSADKLQSSIQMVNNFSTNNSNIYDGAPEYKSRSHGDKSDSTIVDVNNVKNDSGVDREFHKAKKIDFLTDDLAEQRTIIAGIAKRAQCNLNEAKGMYLAERKRFEQLYLEQEYANTPVEESAAFLAMSPENQAEYKAAENKIAEKIAEKRKDDEINKLMSDARAAAAKALSNAPTPYQTDEQEHGR